MDNAIRKFILALAVFAFLPSFTSCAYIPSSELPTEIRFEEIEPNQKSLEIYPFLKEDKQFVRQAKHEPIKNSFEDYDVRVNIAELREYPLTNSFLLVYTSGLSAGSSAWFGIRGGSLVVYKKLLDGTFVKLAPPSIATGFHMYQLLCGRKYHLVFGEHPVQGHPVWLLKENSLVHIVNSKDIPRCDKLD